ncbi:MAG: hypothetical protein L6Q37_10970 [Bdellovibrionaceae bacterium]|nr:hypothetical protein [Pseudobdellovibrionaceae bacterium]NUM57356.1 hypothetical protein [Pseudobdellovibrionaceae bacterium]
MIRRYVNYFTLLVVINPFMIVSFQNCSKVPEGALASLSKEDKQPASLESRLPSSSEKQTVKN